MKTGELELRFARKLGSQPPKSKPPSKGLLDMALREEKQGCDSGSKLNAWEGEQEEEESIGCSIRFSGWKVGLEQKVMLVSLKSWWGFERVWK